MTLLIDTTNREKLIIGLFEKGNLSCFEFDTLKQSEEILPAIEGVLKKEKISLQKIENILVNQGPGSYTGVRVGVTVANALGWSFKFALINQTIETWEAENCPLCKELVPINTHLGHGSDWLKSIQGIAWIKSGGKSFADYCLNQ